MWYRYVSRRIPIVLVGNKIDVRDRKVPARSVTFHKEHRIRYFEVSTKNGYHYEMPFLSLARQLSGDPNLAFTAVRVLFPEIHLDEALVRQFELELAHQDELALAPWRQIPLPDGDHEDFFASDNGPPPIDD
jgi:GTP-binding nuclear protein Ran